MNILEGLIIGVGIAATCYGAKDVIASALEVRRARRFYRDVQRYGMIEKPAPTPRIDSRDDGTWWFVVGAFVVLFALYGAFQLLRVY